jgi:hypothetical protein
MAARFTHHRHGRDLAVVAFRGLAVGALGAGQVAPALQQLTQVVGDLGGRPLPATVRKISSARARSPFW